MDWINTRELNFHKIEDQVPILAPADFRISLAARCRDADDLPRVPLAGCVTEEEDGTRVQIMHNGLKVLAGGYDGTWMEELIRRCKGHHEPQEEVLFHEILRHIGHKATMIELGGWWSFYSLWFQAHFPERRALVIEPDPVHLKVGKTNAALNNCQPIFIQAFWSKQAVPTQPFACQTSGTIDLPGVGVTDLMNGHEIEYLDILHCDAQGIELEMVESCLELFATQRIGWVVLSTHSHHLSNDMLTHQRCLVLLENAGATIVAEHDVHESFSGDGLIVAKFGPLPEAWVQPTITLNRYSSSLFRNPLYDFAAFKKIADARTKGDAEKIEGAMGHAAHQASFAAGLQKKLDEAQQLYDETKESLSKALNSAAHQASFTAGLQRKLDEVQRLYDETKESLSKALNSAAHQASFTAGLQKKLDEVQRLYDETKESLSKAANSAAHQASFTAGLQKELDEVQRLYR